MRKAGETTKKTRILYPYRTPKISGKEGKNAWKTQGNPRKEKKQGNPKRQGKEGEGPKDADHLSAHVHGESFRSNVSVRFYFGKFGKVLI